MTFASISPVARQLTNPSFTVCLRFRFQPQKGQTQKSLALSLSQHHFQIWESLALAIFTGNNWVDFLADWCCRLSTDCAPLPFASHVRLPIYKSTSSQRGLLYKSTSSQRRSLLGQRPRRLFSSTRRRPFFSCCRCTSRWVDNDYFRI